MDSSILPLPFLQHSWFCQILIHLLILISIFQKNILVIMTCLCFKLIKMRRSGYISFSICTDILSTIPHFRDKKSFLDKSTLQHMAGNNIIPAKYLSNIELIKLHSVGQVIGTQNRETEQYGIQTLFKHSDRNVKINLCRNV